MTQEKIDKDIDSALKSIILLIDDYELITNGMGANTEERVFFCGRISKAKEAVNLLHQHKNNIMNKNTYHVGDMVRILDGAYEWSKKYLLRKVSGKARCFSCGMKANQTHKIFS